MADVMTDEFIDSCLAAAAGVALFLVGVPDLEMMGVFYQVRATLEAELSETFGADVATAVAQAFVAAVAARRRELELEARALN